MNDIVAVNVFMFLIWIWIVLFMMPFCNPVSYVVILLPVIAVIIDVIDVNIADDETERTMFQNNNVSVILIVIGIFLGSKAVDHKIDKKFTKWVILAIFFIILSSADIWVSGKRTKALKYFRSLCELFGMTIFLILMLEYFISRSPDNAFDEDNVTHEYIKHQSEHNRPGVTDSTILVKGNLL